MENYFKEKGVFLSSTNLDSTLLVNCLHALLSHYPSLRFTSIVTDEKLNGFRVHFTGPDVTAVLEKKQLRIDDEVVGIYPLTTVLSIYDVGAYENPFFEEDVIEAVCEKYGKVTSVIKFDSEVNCDVLNKKFENSFDSAKSGSLEKKWRVRIDVPEFEGLEIFRSESERFLSLPKWNKMLKVAFWCRCCKMCGHFQNSCPKKLQPVVAMRNESILNGKSNNVDENSITPDIHLQSVSSLAMEAAPSGSRENSSPERTDTFLDTERVQKARKTFRNPDEDRTPKKLKTSESVSDDKSDKSKNFVCVKNIKKEIVDDDDDNGNKKSKQNMECDQSDNTDNETQSDAESDVRRYMSFEEETKLCIDTASNDASDFGGRDAVNGGNSVVLQTYTIIPRALPHLDEPASDLDPTGNDVVSLSWHLLPKNVIKNLEKGEDIKSTEFRNMVRIIADDILRKDSNPPKRLVAKVAKICTKQFPVLKDKFNDIMLGTGYDNLTNKLCTRIENLRRKPKIIHENSESVPMRKTKARIGSYGCVAWSTNLPEGFSVDELVSKKEMINKLCLTSASGMNEAIKLLEETYYLQRISINENFSIKGLLRDWPVLFTERGIESHFKILTDIQLYKRLEDSVTAIARSLLSFLRSSSKNELKLFMTETDIQLKNPNELLFMVLGLAKFFEEPIGAVFFTNEVFNPRDTMSLPKYPCLVGKGTSMLRCEEFMLTIDGIAVNSSIKDPTVAVASWFAAYYIFNYAYASDVSCTLEFIQRCFLGINPVSGSKAERTKGKKIYQGVHPKILKLLEKMNQFDSWLNDCRNK